MLLEVGIVVRRLCMTGDVVFENFEFVKRLVTFLSSLHDQRAIKQIRVTTNGKLHPRSMRYCGMMKSLQINSLRSRRPKIRLNCFRINFYHFNPRANNVYALRRGHSRRRCD